MGTLATLMLSGNPLSRIEEGAFKNLGNLTTLQVGVGIFVFEYIFVIFKTNLIIAII